MKNKEIEELLKYLKNKFYISGEFYTEEKIKVLSKKELELLLSYIEQLEQCYCNRTDCSSRIKDSKKYDSLLQKYEQLENNRDKAIEYFKFENPEIFKNQKYTNHLWTIDGLTIKRFIDKLKGDSDDKK